jgi:hypothetical protein
MVDLISTALRLQQFLELKRWRFCFIGGLCVQHWGEPRLTRDIDLSLLTGFGGEVDFVDSLLAEYSPRIEAAREFALARRVLLLRSEDGIGIDISLAGLPYEEGLIDRAVRVEMLPGLTLRLCSAEDLIVMKVFAGRETDLRDARSIVVRQRGRKLDWVYIETNVAELAELKEDPTMLRVLGVLRQVDEV